MVHEGELGALELGHAVEDLPAEATEIAVIAGRRSAFEDGLAFFRGV